MQTWRERSVAGAIDPALAFGERPMIAFVDQEGTFWPPSIRDAQVMCGAVYVPYEDFMDVASLLEAALRRERKLLSGVAA